MDIPDQVEEVTLLIAHLHLDQVEEVRLLGLHALEVVQDPLVDQAVQAGQDLPDHVLREDPALVEKEVTN